MRKVCLTSTNEYGKYLPSRLLSFILLFAQLNTVQMLAFKAQVLYYLLTQHACAPEVHVCSYLTALNTLALRLKYVYAAFIL